MSAATPAATPTTEMTVMSEITSLLALGPEIANCNQQLEFHKNPAAKGTNTYFVPFVADHSALRCGNRITSRIDVEFVSSIVKRSTPIPSPAVGGIP